MASLVSKVVVSLFLSAIVLAEDTTTKKGNTTSKKEVKVIEDMMTAHSYGLGYSQQQDYGSNGVDYGQHPVQSYGVNHGQHPVQSYGVNHGQHPVLSGSHEGYEKAFVIPVYNYGHTGPAYGQQVEGSLPYGYTSVSFGAPNNPYGSEYYNQPFGRSYYNRDQGMGLY